MNEQTILGPDKKKEKKKRKKEEECPPPLTGGIEREIQIEFVWIVQFLVVEQFGQTYTLIRKL